MGFFRRLFGAQSSAPEPNVSFVIRTPGRHYDEDRELAFVAVGGVEVPGGIWRDNQRDVQDWTSGIRLENPETLSWMRETTDFPMTFRAAGARAVAVVGLAHHADASRQEFGVGQAARLIPEPTNPVDPRAIAVRSIDGRYLAGYIPADEVEALHAASPPCGFGLVVWENFTWRPRTRKGLRLVVGPSIRLRVVPPNQREREWARRDAIFHAAQRAAEERWERERAEREARERQVAEWRASGRCIDCGTPIEQKGRFVRCLSCRAANRRSGTPGEDMAPRTYANSECPYCRVGLDPLPRAKKACPACGKPIYIRSGPDGLTYLLQDIDLPTMEAAWAEYHAQKGEAELRERLTETGRLLATALAEYQRDGVRVEILTDERSCPECRKFAGHIFDVRGAPLLPYAQCGSEFCRCDYVPVIE